MPTADMTNVEAAEKANAEHIDTATDSIFDGDVEAPTARGVESDDIPYNYWWSYQFLGSGFSIILLAVSLYVNFSLPSNALTVINADLGYSASYIWISDGGLVVTCVGLLIIGRLGDIIGRRYFLIGGQVFGVIGSAICAKATSINMLIAGSTIYGIASSTQLTFPYVIQELVPNKHRGIAQGVVIAGVLPFAGFGTIIARELIQYSSLGWRWCYMLNVIFNALALVLLAELVKLDYGGIVLFSAAAVLIILGLNWGGGTYPWEDAHVLGPLIAGGVSVALFALYETFMPLEQPLLPIKLLKNRGYVAIVIVASIGQMALTALSILWPQQIEYLYTTDNIKIGWMSITVGLSMTFTVLAGFFSGWLDVICLVANGLVNHPGDLGLANGFIGSIKQVVGTVSVSIYVAILQNKIAVNLPRDVTTAAINAGLPADSVTAAIDAVSNGTAAAMAAIPGINATIELAIADGVKKAWSSSFSTVYYSSLAFAGVAVIASFFSVDVDKYMTNYVSRRIGGTVAMEIAPEKTIKNLHLTDDD
ncbi:hypothetical protein SBRCBS47491_000666 [Sporothrix bragantina]|uniref:Major facilitator superfamily (MFS) profile domain-containing protein n=1 Tax=Sporothrix bragantina TaxID=671064 RepID=A0ABP0ASA9_9PEZI